MTPKNDTTVLVLSLLVTLALVATGLWWFTNRSGIKLGSLTQNQSNSEETIPNSSQQPVQKRISAGEKSLIPGDTTPEKQAAVQAIASGHYREIQLLRNKRLYKRSHQVIIKKLLSNLKPLSNAIATTQKP